MSYCISEFLVVIMRVEISIKNGTFIIVWRIKKGKGTTCLQYY